MSYTLFISESYYDIEDVAYQVIIMKIVIDTGTFINRADPLYVSVSDGSTKVESFLNDLSGNRKEIIAVFTTDAFASFVGLVDIEFAYSQIPIGIFKDVDIQTEIEPLNPVITAPQADNAWLASLS